MLHTFISFTWHTWRRRVEESWTKAAEQQRRDYRWEKDTVSSAVISKGVNAFFNRYSALEK